MSQRKQFESSVNLYGSKTTQWYNNILPKFESSVNLYGSKTINPVPL